MSETKLNQSSDESYKIGVGIRGMRERVHQLGGTMEFISGNPGTILQVTFPLYRILDAETSQYSEATTPKAARVPGNGQFRRE